MISQELGSKLIRYMKSKGWRIRRLNIVYLEDVNADTWQPVTGKLDQWDDVRIIVSDAGTVSMSAEATCEPGAHYTYNPMNPRGAFRVANDVQFLDAWQFGMHHRQEALVQCASITGFRDANKDGVRTGDVKVVGPDFGVNQHTTGNDDGDPPPDRIGLWSAGCFVGRWAKTHYNKFLPLVRSMGLKTYDTAIVPGDKFAQFQ